MAFDLSELIVRQRAFSERTFGHGFRPATLANHIGNGLDQIDHTPHDLDGWVGMILLALDGAWRNGHGAAEIATALWQAAAPGAPMEHVRDDGTLCPGCRGDGNSPDCGYRNHPGDPSTDPPPPLHPVLRHLPVEVLALVGDLLEWGARKYPDARWRRQTVRQHAQHALQHLLRAGTDPESGRLDLLHAAVRCLFAVARLTGFGVQQDTSADDGSCALCGRGGHGGEP